jgi:hypothetical protein
VHASARSRMNIPFRVCRNGQPDEALEKQVRRGTHSN